MPRSISLVAVIIVTLTLQVQAENEEAVALVKVGDGAFETGNPVAFSAWIVYGTCIRSV